MNNLIFKIALSILVFLFIQNTLDADIFYWPSEYNTIYNEKVALEIELKRLKEQYSNEKEKLVIEKRGLDSKTQTLTDELALCNKSREDDKDTCIKRIAELNEKINVLKSSSNSREKSLIEHNNKVETDLKKEIDDLKAKLEQAEKDNIKKTEALKNEYENKIGKCENRLSDLNNEISNLKKLNETQKQELERMANQTKELEDQLKGEIDSGQIRLKRCHNKIIINLDDKISFPSGSSNLKKEIMPALDKITKILGNYPENEIRIEGHTDNIPMVKGAQFKDNWQLSTERALSVLRYILRDNVLDKIRFSAAGYGEHQPIVDNDTPDNRSLNRRVDIVVIPKN